MQATGRKYKRLDTDWVVNLRARDRTAADRIRNISTTGVFIETTQPYPPSSMVEFDFALPGRDETVHAVGLVRWVNDGRHDGLPVGMGVEFSRVTASIEQKIQEIVNNPLAGLQETPEHRAVLAVYKRRIGDKVTLDQLVTETGIPREKLAFVLVDFTVFDFVALKGNTITFKPCDDPVMLQALDAV